MKRAAAVVLSMCLLAAWARAGMLEVSYAYHDDADGTDDRATENIPGETYAFIGNASTSIRDDDTVTLYAITANQFAGDAEEQILVRWWNGEEEHWIMGTWEKNLFLGAGENAKGPFHNCPPDGEVMVDLWKFEIGPGITRPGENYYVIQLKGWSEEGATEYYLLRDGGADGAGENNVGQAWTPEPNYFEHDWSVQITE